MRAEHDIGTQILLPFAEKEYVSMSRACRILGLKWNAVWKLTNERPPRLEVIDYAFGSHKRIRYRSIVSLCDELRVKFNIADRRPRLSAPYLRHRDEDLLPFPLSDTVGVDEALAALGYETLRPLWRLMRLGAFDAYQLSGGSPWRISRISLAAHISRSRKGARQA